MPYPFGQTTVSKITFLIEYMWAAFDILCPCKDLRRLKKWDVISGWPLGFSKKEEGQTFEAIQEKIKIYFYSQKPKIHYGGMVDMWRVLGWLVSTLTHT